MAESFYNSEFQDRHVAGSLASAGVVLPLLFEYLKPLTVVDAGCGLGAWLKVARQLGAQEILGLDGDQVDRARLLIEPEEFQGAELSEPISTKRRFDLAISIEVAEHLPYSRSESFVADLAALSDVILFSAAAPYQGGTNHINEQWLEFWGILFRRFGYVACDLIRPQVWGNPAVEFWYRQNLMIFCKAETAAIFPADALAAARALSYTHPLNLLSNGALFRPLMQQAWELECLDYSALTRAYIAGDTVLPPLKIPGAVAKDNTRFFPDARTRVHDATADIAVCHAEMSRYLAYIDQLLKDYEDLRRYGDDLLRDVGARNAQVERLESELVRSQGEVGRLNGEITRLIDEKARESGSLNERAAHEIGRLEECVRQEKDRAARFAAAFAARNREALLARKTAWRKIWAQLDSLQSRLSAKARRRRDAGIVRASGLFDESYYRAQCPDLEKSGSDPVNHYVEYGAAQGRDPNPLFHTAFYLANNPDVVRSGMNPLAHYHAFGGAEGRDPNPTFQTSAYLAQNPDVLPSGMTPLLHFLAFCQTDG